jgi:ribonuclease HI
LILRVSPTLTINEGAIAPAESQKHMTDPTHPPEGEPLIRAIAMPADANPPGGVLCVADLQRPRLSEISRQLGNSHSLENNLRRKHVVIYTDGACSPNPGPGGCSGVLLYEKHRKEIAEGYRHTTNNRMEPMAVVRALESLNQKCSVQIFTDSRYVRDAFERGWIKKWKSNGWKTTLREDVLNTDLWAQLCELCQAHHCVFHWIKGHDRTKEMRE